MCRVIRVSDLLGAAGEYASGGYSHENWDGGPGVGLNDLNDSREEGLEADGMTKEEAEQPTTRPSSAARVTKAIRKVEAIPQQAKALKLKSGARLR